MRWDNENLRFALLFWSMCFCLLSSDVSAQTCEATSGGKCYYIATSGNDTNSGTFAAPFRTVHRGVSAAVAGDFVYIRSGTYDEIDGGSSHNDCPDADCGTLNPIRSGAVGRPITFKGYPGEAMPVIRGSSAASSQRYAAIISTYSNITFDSLEITNGYRGITILGNGGPAQNLVIRNCHIHHNNGSTEGNNNGGIVLLFTYASMTQNILIENNHIHDNKDPTCGVPTGAGIQLYGVTNLTVRNNTIHDEYGGVYGKGNLGYGTSSSQTQIGGEIYGNTIYNVESGIYFNTGSNFKIYDNTVYGFSLSGIGNSAHDNRVFQNHQDFSYYNNTVIGSEQGACFVFKNTPNTNVYNNIFMNCLYRASTSSCNSSGDSWEREFANRGFADDGPDLATNFREDNNLVYNSSGAYNFCWYNKPYTLSGWRSYWQGLGGVLNGQASISVAPTFVNAGLHNYNLSVTGTPSSGIDAGALIANFHCTSSGGTSPAGCRKWCGLSPDMGAHEYCPGTDSNPPAAVSNLQIQ